MKYVWNIKIVIGIIDDNDAINPYITKFIDTHSIQYALDLHSNCIFHNNHVILLLEVS